MRIKIISSLLIIFFATSSSGQKVFPNNEGVIKKSEYYNSFKNHLQNRAIIDLTVPAVKSYSNRRIFQKYQMWEQRLCVYAGYYAFLGPFGEKENIDSLSNDIDFIFQKADYFSDEEIECIKSTVLRNLNHDESCSTNTEQIKCKLRRFLQENIHKVLIDGNGNKFKPLKNSTVEWSDYHGKHIYVFNSKSELVEVKTVHSKGYSIYSYDECVMCATYKRYSKEGVLIGEGNTEASDSTYNYTYHLNGEMASHTVRNSNEYNISVKFNEEGDTTFYSLQDYRSEFSENFIRKFYRLEDSGKRIAGVNYKSDTLMFKEIKELINVNSKEGFQCLDRVFNEILYQSNDTSTCISTNLQKLEKIDNIKLSKIEPIVRVACEMTCQDLKHPIPEINYKIKKRRLISRFEEFDGRIKNQELLENVEKYYSKIDLAREKEWPSLRNLFVALRSRMNDEERKVVFANCMNKVLRAASNGFAEDIEVELKLTKLNILDTLGTHFKSQMTPLVTDYLNTLSQDNIEFIKSFKKKYEDYLETRVGKWKAKNKNNNYNLYTSQIKASIKIADYLKRIPNLENFVRTNRLEIDENLSDLVVKFSETFGTRGSAKSQKLNELQNAYFDLIDENIEKEIAYGLYSRNGISYNLLGWMLMFIDEH